MTTSKAKYGIFLHSDSEQHAFKYSSNNITGQQIIWTSLSPAYTNEVNSKILDKILALVGNSLDGNLMNDET